MGVLSTDYFGLFGLEVDFTLDVQALEQTYFSLQKEYHPDRFTNVPDAERLESLQKATTINEGYNILKDPLRRGEYLLELADRKVGEPSQVLLMEAMEQREGLVEAEDAAAIGKLEEKNLQQVQQCVAVLREAFAVNDLDRAAELVLRLKYLQKFADEIRIKRLKGLAYDAA